MILVKLQVDRYTDITWDATYIIWAEYSVCDIPCAHEVDRYTDITWDVTYIIWAEYSVCDIPCDMVHIV